MTRRDLLRLLGMSALAANGSSGAGAADSILSREIPSTGERLPIIGLGTWQTFDVGGSAAARKPLEEVLSLFYKLGGRVVDSSPMYGRSEEVLGDLAARLEIQEELFIATKVWTSGRAAGIAQMNDSQHKLRGRIDLMQVHNLVDADTHLATLREWKRAGRIRHMGVTHYTVGAYQELQRYLERDGLDFVQVNYSLVEREAEQRILPLAAERRIAVLINRPFAGGEFFRRVRGKEVPPWASEIGCTTWAQLALKFVVSHPAVTCAIPATDKSSHLNDNMRAGRGPLPDAAMRRKIADAYGRL